MTDIKIGISATGQAEIGKQINDTAAKVDKTASGMGGIIQKANQYYQQLTQSKNLLEQKDQQHHRKELERIQKEIEARKVLLEETERRPATTAAEQAKRTVQVQQEQRVIENLERQAATPYTAPQRAPMRIPGARGAMRVGGAVAGLMGAYSLFSKISGGMGSEDQASTELAKTMLTMPGGGAGFQEVREMLTSEMKILGDTALITAKDMQSMIGALRETGDMSEKSREIQIRIANEAKRMNVDPSVVGGIQQQLLRFGGIGGGGDFLQMQRRIGGREGMSHRVEEMLRTQAETMMALSHGANMTGGATIENILGLLDKSGMKMYSGQRGGQLMQRLDQGFRGGGSEIFENMAYLALSPMKQKRVRGKGGFGSGLYDAYAADWIQEQGAFATKSSLMKSAIGLGNEDLADYIRQTRTGESTNIELVMSQFKKGLDIRGGGGENLRFAAEFSSQMGGASSSDIMALNKVLSGERREAFLVTAKKFGLDKKGSAEYAGALLRGDPEAEKFLKGKRTTETIFEEIGKNLNKVIEENKFAINKALKELSGFIKTGTETTKILTKFLEKWLGKKELTTSEKIEESTDILAGALGISKGTMKKSRKVAENLLGLSPEVDESGEFGRTYLHSIKGMNPKAQRLVARSLSFMDAEKGGGVGLWKDLRQIQYGTSMVGRETNYDQIVAAAEFLREKAEGKTGRKMDDATYIALLASSIGKEMANFIARDQQLKPTPNVIGIPNGAGKTSRYGR